MICNWMLDWRLIGELLKENSCIIHKNFEKQPITYTGNNGVLYSPRRIKSTRTSTWIDNTIHWEPYWNITLYVWMIRICRVLSYITTFLGQLIISLVIGTYICHSLLLYDGFLIIQWSFMPIKARYRIDTYITIEYSITK